MPVPVKVPKLGMTMTEATLVRWLAAAGDKVEEKQPLAEIETEKIVSELQSPARGILTKCSLTAGDVATVAQTIAWILVDGEGESEKQSPNAVESTVIAPQHQATDSAVPAAPTAEMSRATGATSPAVRRLARELAVDLQTVIGSGPSGRIVKQDVLSAAQQPPISVKDDSVLVPHSATRRAIIQTVTKSAAIPQIVLYGSADVSALIELRQQHQTFTYNDILVSLVANALQDHKYLNATYEEQGIRLHARANIGFAVAVEEGLLIPVIQKADRLTLDQIADERQRLVELARSRRIGVEQMSGGTFTISNLGMFSVDSFTALIYPPQSTILSVGRIQQIAMPVDRGGVVFRPRMTFGLTLDHRVADGAVGAAFLKDFISRIENLNLKVA